MVSTEIKKYFEQKIDKDYTGFVDRTKCGRIFKDALYRVINERIANLTVQKNYDEISFLIKVGQSYSLNSNKIITGLTPVVSVAIISATIYEITCGFPHNLITGDSVVISGIQGTTNANGTYSVTVVNSAVFRITVGSAIGVNIANTGSFYGTKQIPDYYRLTAIKTTFRGDRSLSITKAAKTTPIRVSFTGVNSLRTGEQVFIQGVGGNTNANGTFYINKVNSGTIDLYSDAHLLSPVVGNANYTSGGTIVSVESEYATPIDSDRKISSLSQATIKFPKFEESQHSLVIYPLDYVCINTTLDYISTPKEIDFFDTDTNYTLYYNDKFLYYLIDSATKIFLAEIRDTEGYQIMSKETQDNK